MTDIRSIRETADFDDEQEQAAVVVSAEAIIEAAACKTCGGSGMVYPHPTALVVMRCPSC